MNPLHDSFIGKKELISKGISCYIIAPAVKEISDANFLRVSSRN